MVSHKTMKLPGGDGGERGAALRIPTSIGSGQWASSSSDSWVKGRVGSTVGREKRQRRNTETGSQIEPKL